MANLSTRVIYDANELSMFDKANKDANTIIMDDSVKESNSACYAKAGSRNAQSEMTRPMIGTKLGLGNKADIENRVMNRTYELNNDAGRTNKDFMSNIGNVPSECNVKETLTFENSRYTNPVVDYREMYTAPYAFTPYLFVSPQTVTAGNDKMMNPNRYGESSRYSAKLAKYDLKPKQYSAVNKPVDYQELYKGLLPTFKYETTAAKPYA
jgi:hypothetical protein